MSLFIFFNIICSCFYLLCNFGFLYGFRKDMSQVYITPYIYRSLSSIWYTLLFSTFIFSLYAYDLIDKNLLFACCAGILFYRQAVHFTHHDQFRSKHKPIRKHPVYS